jgi:hypothetical protein
METVAMLSPPLETTVYPAIYNELTLQNTSEKILG